VAHAVTPTPPATSPSAGWSDVQGGRHGPDPGSQPRAVDAKPQSQDVSGASNAPWSFLRGPEAGAHLFVAGFVALLFSIGGLVAVGVRRHRW
jgi:predicted phage tail protein